MDSLNSFAGWKTILDRVNAWIQYNSIDFGNNEYKSVDIMSQSAAGGSIELRLNNINGPVIAQAEIPEEIGWHVVNCPVLKFQPGIHNLILRLKDNKMVEVDWINFK